jgi:hypothetical protein
LELEGDGMSNHQALIDTLTEDELRALWAALWAMDKDGHAAQDCLTHAQWDAAHELLKSLDKEVNLRSGYLEDVNFD